MIANWVTKHLQSDDLAALSCISQRQYDKFESGQIERLYRRGYVVRHDYNKPRITASGRAALVIWKITQR